MSGHTVETSSGGAMPGWSRIVAQDKSTVGYTPDAVTAILHAAAPELLEALRELVKWMDDSGLSATSPGGVGPLHYGTTEYSVVTAARAAIAKAEGR